VHVCVVYDYNSRWRTEVQQQQIHTHIRAGAMRFVHYDSALFVFCVCVCVRARPRMLAQYMCMHIWQVRCELGVVQYDRNVLGTNGPRKMQVCLPLVTFGLLRHTNVHNVCL
jgi:hypothetical protein